MSSTPKDTAIQSKPESNDRKQGVSKSTLLTGLLLFLGLSWFLSQSAFVHKIKQHFPSTTEGEGKMNGKRTVGYFVSFLSFLRD